MKRLRLRTVTVLSTMAIAVGTIQSANAAPLSDGHKLKPAAPSIFSVMETAPVTTFGKSAKTYSNLVVYINEPASGVAHTLITVNGGKGCKIIAPAISCTITKMKIGKTVKISAKSKFVNSGYGQKSEKFSYLIKGERTTPTTPTPIS